VIVSTVGPDAPAIGDPFTIQQAPSTHLPSDASYAD